MHSGARRHQLDLRTESAREVSVAGSSTTTAPYASPVRVAVGKRCCEVGAKADSSGLIAATLPGDRGLVRWQGTYPLQDDAGQPMSESWLIRNHELALRRGGRLTMVRSRDGGRSWDTVDLTDPFFTHPGAGLAWFIGAGIQLRRGRHAGRLLVPARYFTGNWQEVDPDRHRILYYHPTLGQVYDDGEGQVAQVLDSEAHNAVIYSDDHGESWHWGGSSQGYVGEACIVELAGGAVYMNNRNHDPRSLGYRSWCISRDGGESFTEFGVDRTLIEGRCHAALARCPASGQRGGGPILFSNPASFEGVNQLHTREIGSAARRDLTVRVSYDECRT
ncbi:MAG: sialidase family protein [Spirochaetaceae bacterium]|nr:sialidase family protein [Spirochaetaceae bacterium]